MPAELVDRRIDRGVHGCQLEAGQHRRGGRSQALGQVDEVIHRDGAAAVDWGDLIREGTDRLGIAGSDRDGDPIEQCPRVTQELAKPEFVVPVAQGRIVVERDLQRSGGESGAGGVETCRGGWEAGSQVGRRQAEGRVAHDAAVYRAPRGRRAGRVRRTTDTMAVMDDQPTTERTTDAQAGDRSPGDRSPNRPTPLDRPPSDRYAPLPVPEAASLRTQVGRALGVALAGAAIIVVLGGPLSMTAGLLVVSVVVGLIVGAILRSQTLLAVVIAVGSVVVGLLGVWLFARSEGGVLGPLDYFAEVQGPLAPIQLLFAALAAVVSSR